MIETYAEAAKRAQQNLVDVLIMADALLFFGSLVALFLA